MDERTEQMQAILLEPMIYHIDGGALLADEKHALAAENIVGYQIGDRLRFARSRRPLNDVALACSGSRNG